MNPSNSRKLPGTTVVVANVEALAEAAAASIAGALQRALSLRGEASLALSGGSTPSPTYTRLAKDPLIDWCNVHIFWVDDRAVPEDHPRSNFGAAKAVLLAPASVPANQVHPMNGSATDLAQAARDYAATLARVIGNGHDVPTLDVVILGVGDDGHTASLFPGDPAVHERATPVVAVQGGDGREARLSLTAPVLERARNIYVLASGATKKPALERVAAPEGSLDETPARLLRRATGSITWFVDTAAAPSGAHH